MATGYLLPIGALFQAFSDQGVIGSGYKINTYVGGSVNTPVTTYTDATLTVANANPIVLGSNGRFASLNVWVPSGTLVKLVMTDANGNVLVGGTIDNVPGVNDFSALSATQIGQALWPQTASELAASVTPTSYLYPPGDLRRYGAVPDNATDSTAAIQRAINGNQGSGTIIQIIGGMYVVSSALSVTNSQIFSGSGTTGFGAGGGTGIRTTSTTADVFTCNTALPVEFRDFTIISNAQKTSGNGNGITIVQSGTSINRLSRIERMYIYNMSVGISLTNCANWTIANNLIQNFSTQGIYAGATATSPDLGDSLISGNVIWDFNITTGDSCIRLDPNAGIEIIGNKLLSAQFGVRVTASQGPTGTVNIVGNSFEQQTSNCINFQQVAAGKIYNNVTISSNEFSIVGTGGGSAINIQQGTFSTYISNLTITGNVCNMATATVAACISIADGNGVTLSGNVVNANSVAGMTYAYDVVTGTNATNVSVSGNKAINLPGGVSVYSPNTVQYLPIAAELVFSTGANNVAAASTVWLGAAESYAVGTPYNVYPTFDYYIVRAYSSAQGAGAPGVGQTFTYTVCTGASGATPSAVTWSVTGATADGSDVTPTHASGPFDPSGNNTNARLGVKLVTSAGATASTHRVTVQLAKAS